LRYRDNRLAFGLHLNSVIEGADPHLGAAADQRLQGTGAALHIGDLDIEARASEVAEPLGDRKRQIEDRRLATDRQPWLGYFRLVLRHGRGEQRDCEKCDGRSPDMAHRRFPRACADRSGGATCHCAISIISQGHAPR
jgi:hypothetical protein